MTAVDFQHFRILLKRRRAADLIDDAVDRDLNREDWLRSRFSKRINFEHRGKKSSYVPLSSILGKPIIGRVGRQVKKTESLSSDELLLDTVREAWHACYLILDPSHHEDGQKIALQEDVAVGKPAALLRSLGEILSDIEDHPIYTCEISAIPLPGSFWAFADSHGNLLKRLSIRSATPNMFGGDDNYQDELRQLRDQENVEVVESILISKEGMTVNTKRLHEVVDYVEKGGGNLSATAMSGAKYSS
jgi:hypothetical protein